MIPLRVLILPGRDPYGQKAMGGAESSMRLLAEALAARGHAVFVAAEEVSDESCRRARAKGVVLKRWEGPKGLGLCRAVLALRRIAEGCDVEVAYVFYDRRLMRAALALRRLKPKLKVAVRMAGLRWAIDVDRRASLRRAYARAFNRADAVNFLHPALKEMTCEAAQRLGMDLKFRGSLTADIGSSARVGRSTPYSPEGPDGTVEVVMAARFSDYQKRQDLLIEAMALLPRTSPVRLTLVGEGRRKAICAARISDLGLGDRVRILPFETQDALWARLEAAHLLAIATDFEGLGKIVVEAMAIGLPVVASDVRPLSEYISEGQTGFLVANTASAWARRLNELAQPESSARRCRVSNGAMAYVRAAHDPARNVLHYETFFRGLLDRTKGCE